MLKKFVSIYKCFEKYNETLQIVLQKNFLKDNFFIQCSYTMRKTIVSYYFFSYKNWKYLPKIDLNDTYAIKLRRSILIS